MIFSCNKKEDTPPTSETITSMEQLNISPDFDWSASLEGEINITLENPLNVSTEGEFIQIINKNGEVLDYEIVHNLQASFDVNLPRDSEYYLYFPVTEDKTKISSIGEINILLGPTVDYIYPSFKSTDVVSCTSCDSPIINAGCELPGFASGWRLFHENDVPGWETTATDNKIEQWATGFKGVAAQEGRHFFELNANQVAALYQELCLEPGSTIQWSVWHRGRSGVDVAEVKIGSSVETAILQETMSDGNTSWGFYSGSYNVPADQETTVFVFESVSASGGSNSIGNFLDNFEIDCDFDGDGVIDRYDAFPEDPDQAFISQFPGDGKQIVAFEDLWPSLGDFDFNDLVLTNQVEILKNSDNELVNAKFKVSIDAIGASIDNGIGMILYTANKGIFANNIIASVEGDVELDPENTNGLILTDDIFSTINNRYQNNGVGPEGRPDTLNFTITFNSNATDFIPELYLFRTNDRSHEVHRSGFPATATINTSLFNTEDDAGDYKTESGLIWGMEIITDDKFKNAREKIDILLAYPEFQLWATSEGTQNQTWYLSPEEDKVVDIEFDK
jgi:LruC domain-containing protein